MDEDIKPPVSKIGPISMDAGALLHAALERVWLTKYFGTPAEIFIMPTDRPLCEILPKVQPKEDIKNGVAIWWHKCVPLEIKWKVTMKI